MMMDRYEFLDEIGGGGMGKVWLAWDKHAHRNVALKTIAPHRREEQAYFNYAFYQEAQVMASLQHPNLVEIYDFGLQPDGASYLSMEYIEGCPLDALYHQGITLPWPLLAQLTNQLLDGLAHAHARNVIHRDLKPSNIMLKLQGSEKLPVVKIIDFGIALFQEEQRRELAERVGGDLLHNLPLVPTPQEGLLLTPPYAAPEQLHSGPYYQGAATDLYALGVLLYQFCSGQIPFQHNDFRVMLTNMLQTSPPPLRERSINQTPDAVADLIYYDLLHKKPWKRIAHARQLQQALQPFWSMQEALQHWQKIYLAIQFHLLHKAKRTESQELAATLPASPGEHKTIMVGTLETLPSQVDNMPKQLPTTDLSAVLRLVFRLPPLCGRQHDLDLLVQRITSHLQQAPPQKSLVLLQGEAGIGKSRLAQAAMEYAQEHLMMPGLRATLQHTETPFQGVIAAIERYFGWTGAERQVIESLLLKRWGQDPVTRTLIASTGELLRPTTTQEAEVGPSEWHVVLDRPELRYRVLLDILQRIAEEHAALSTGTCSLLFWLDNLELVDQETCGFLQQLQQHPKLSVLVLATFRDQQCPPHTTDLIQELVDSWSGHTQPLGPLSLEHTQQLFQELLPLDHGTLAALHQRSQGNPLFMLQYVYAWAQQYQLQRLPEQGVYRATPEALHAIPKATRALWEQRLQVLSSHAHQAALALTTLGSSLLPELVEELLSRLQLPTQTVLGELLEKQLLLSEFKHLTWSHRMLEEHCSEELRHAANATEVYRVAVNVLELHPQAQRRDIVRLRAQHMLRSEDSEAAFSLIMAFVQQEWQLRRDGRAVLEDLRFIQSVVPDESAASFLRWQAEALFAQSELEETLQVLARAEHSLLDQTSQIEQAHIQRIRAAVLDTLGLVTGDTSHREIALQQVSQALEQFNTLGLLAGQAECRLLLANILYNQSRYSEAVAWAHSAVLAFERCEAPRGEAQSIMLLGFIYSDQGLYENAAQWIAKAAQSYGAMHDQMGQAQCQFWQGWRALYQQRWADCTRLTEAAAVFFEAQEVHWWLGVTLLLQGWLCSQQQRWADGQQHASAALKIFQAMHLGHEQGQALLLQAVLALYQDHQETAASLCEQIQALERPEPMLQQSLALVLAWLALLRQDTETAVAQVQQACQTWRSYGLTTFGAPLLLQHLLTFDWPTHIQLDLDAWYRSLGVLRSTF